MSAQVAADLRAAAEVLRRDGWTQMEYTDARGCHCLMGAVFTVLGDPRASDDHERVDEAREVLDVFLGRRPHLWNDAPDRTADEVIAALEAAADAAEAQS